MNVHYNERENTKPIAFIDENGAIVIVGEEAFNRAGFVDSDRAIPASWNRLIIEREHEKRKVYTGRVPANVISESVYSNTMNQPA
jgi:hypothetical protein